MGTFTALSGLVPLVEFMGPYSEKAKLGAWLQKGPWVVVVGVTWVSLISRTVRAPTVLASGEEPHIQMGN